ncbi:MAG: hypothetical protein NT049_06890, partial [Planctomycetota bacterium]|nr:hypothetical protein [Planctomycetota bacterium]
LAAGIAQARNVDLVTLPPRDSVQLTIYNSEDLTLVREVRSITFKKGVNLIEFSWANTLIDPTSAYFRPLQQENQIEVLDTTFPADRPQVLVWNVESKFEGQVQVEVSYFTSGISWNADYVMITNAAETQASLDGYVTVVNNSGEDYEGAQVRLVVGVVNLVEKIARLAQLGRNRNAKGDELEMLVTNGITTKVKSGAMLDAIEAADDFKDVSGVEREVSKRKAPPKVVKEGLSEYFIFTVEGQQTVKNQWSQRMVSFRTRDVPFEVLYRYRPHQYGPKPVRFFILANDAEHKMGESPLPDGTIRVFRENGREGLSFFTAQTTKYVSVKEKIELNVGPDNQIVYERVVLDLARQNFIYDENAQPIPLVVGWDETRKWQEEIRNYRAKPIKMEVRHVLPGDVEFGMQAPAVKLYDFHTPEYVLEVGAGQKQKWASEGTFHLGRNQKQDRVRLAGQ